MTDEVKVRIATPDDVHQLMEMGMAANDEVGFCKANPEKLLRDIWPALHMHDGIVGVIGKPGEVIQGGVVLKVTNLWYSDDLFLEERIVYLRPEFRRGGRSDEKHCHLRKLVEFSKKAADDLGLPLVVGIATSVGFEGKAKQYERFLGPQSGAFFLYGRRHHEDVYVPAEAAE